MDKSFCRRFQIEPEPEPDKRETCVGLCNAHVQNAKCGSSAASTQQVELSELVADVRQQFERLRV